MANYGQLSYGSKGSEVKTLQELLKNNGYADLAVDGDFGAKTQAAVRDYQQKNGLAVDGIVGNNTWSALTAAPADTTSTPTENNSAGTTSNAYTYEPYTPSDAVTQADTFLQEMKNNKPGEYQSSWYGELKDTIAQILNRDKFTYDLNGDMFYQQYKDQYINQGKMAMMDAMGQAASMTGGHGNSYAQSVGQQAYQGYLQQLNDKVPEFYGLALDQYNKEGQELYDQASFLAGMEEQEYSRYMDQLTNYYTELGLASDDARYQAELDYNKWVDSRDFGYQQWVNDIANDQWQQEFDFAKKQYDDAMAQSSGGGGGSGSSGDGYDYDTHGYTKEEIMQIQESAGIAVDGIWGPDTEKAYNDGHRPRNSGSYYKTALSDLKQMKSEGYSDADVSAFLREAVEEGWLTQSEQITLYNKYRDNKL